MYELPTFPCFYPLLITSKSIDFTGFFTYLLPSKFLLYKIACNSLYLNKYFDDAISLYIEYGSKTTDFSTIIHNSKVDERYSSNFFLFISFLLPIRITKLHRGSFARLRNLLIPIPEYAAASSNERLSFSQTGMSCTICTSPFINFLYRGNMIFFELRKF